jgi:hypothetical protein
VPIRNLHILHEWGERENPPYRLWRLVEQWVLRLYGRPWQAPSEPLTENVGQATEIRVAEVPDSEGIAPQVNTRGLLRNHLGGTSQTAEVHRRSMGAGDLTFASAIRTRGCVFRSAGCRSRGVASPEGRQSGATMHTTDAKADPIRGVRCQSQPQIT